MTKTSNKYDAQISNLKGLLIFLVLLGHYLIAAGGGERTVTTDIIYSFHMPAFIFVSGVLNQRITFEKIKRLLRLFLIFQPLFLILGFLTGYYGTVTWQSLLKPAFHLWYLPSLAVWMGMALLLTKIGKRSSTSIVIVLGLVLVALVNRYFYGSQLFTITRILSFSPYFFAGYYLTPERFSKIATRLSRYRVWAYLLIAGLIGASILVFSRQPQEYLNLFYGYVSKDGFSSTILGYSLNVVMALVLGFVWIVLLVVAVPKERTCLVNVGDHTLWIYILHPILFYLLMVKKDALGNLDSYMQLILAVWLAISVFSIFSMVNQRKKSDRLSAGFQRKSRF